MEKTGQWERIKELFDAVLERSPEDRAAFLTRECGGDPSLRIEVESLLSAYDRSDGLSRPAVALDRHAEAEPSQLIGPYRLLRRIGEGGMGQVWLAEQTEPIRRQVAIKLIRSGIYDDSLLARFLDERQSLALMEHPAIAKVFDAGATADGQPYFVMEYVSGQPITKYCDEKNLSIRERLELFIKACEGVQHAHQKAIIHRDLKPANILVVEIDGQATPRIIDFGLARAIGVQSGPQSDAIYGSPANPARTEIMVGTPGYMSPEQIGAADIDTRSDVYSLGVVLYELLTGQLPFDSISWKNLPVLDACKQMQEQITPRPSLKAGEKSQVAANAAACRQTKPNKLAGQLAGDLDLITFKALNKDRQFRYGGASELAADLRRYLRKEPVDAHPATKGYKLHKYLQRHRVGAAMAATLVLLLAGFAVLQAVQLRRIARERDRANRIADFMTSMFSVPDPSESRGNQVTAREILDKAAQGISTGLAKDPQMQAQLMYVMGKTYMGLGLYSESESLLRRALEIQQRVLGQNDRETAKTLNDLGTCLMFDGKFAEAEKAHRQALTILLRTIGPNTIDSAKVMNNIASSLVRLGQYQDAAQFYRQSLAIQKKLESPNDPRMLSPISNLGVVDYYLGDFAEAERVDREAIDMRRKLNGPDHPETLKPMNNLATLFNAEGRFADAEMLNRQVLDARRRVLGPDHPDTLRSLSNLAGVLEEEGQLEEAEKLERELLDARRRVLGPDNVVTFETMQQLAAALAMTGQIAEGGQLLREAVDGLRRVAGPDNPSTIGAVIDEAYFQEQQGHYGDAEAADRAILDPARRILGAENPHTRMAMNFLALTLAHEGHYAEAEDLAKQALDLENKARAPQHLAHTYSTYFMACIAAMEGKRDEAVSLLQNAVDQGLWPHVALFMDQDPDLKGVRGDPHFEALLARVKKTASPAQQTASR